jgi:hypothetical protein
MRLPATVEHELRALERQLDAAPGQHAGPTRLRGLRAAIAAALERAGGQAAAPARQDDAPGAIASGVRGR